MFQFRMAMAWQRTSSPEQIKPWFLRDTPAFQIIPELSPHPTELGYYTGDVTGSLGPASRQALSAYQRDYGLEVNGAIDEATVRALGLI